MFTGTATSLILPMKFLIQPKLSIIVTEYVPAAKFVKFELETGVPTNVGLLIKYW